MNKIFWEHKCVIFNFFAKVGNISVEEKTVK